MFSIKRVNVPIKAVVQAILSYIMSILSLPKTLCTSLTCAVAKFWWKSVGKPRGIHWRKFNALCSPNKLGVLGFKDFSNLNTALLTKQVWRLMEDPNSYWASTLKAIYFPNSNFQHANSTRGTSWVWKSMVQGRNLLKKAGRWGISSGQEVHITEDNQMASGNSVSLNSHATIQKVSDLISHSNEWNLDVLRHDMSPTSAIEVLQTPICWSSQKDYLFWLHTHNGTYSVKLDYHKLMEFFPFHVEQATTSTRFPMTFGTSSGLLECLKNSSTSCGDSATTFYPLKMLFTGKNCSSPHMPNL